MIVRKPERKHGAGSLDNTSYLAVKHALDDAILGWIWIFPDT